MPIFASFRSQIEWQAGFRSVLKGMGSNNHRHEIPKYPLESRVSSA